MGLDRILCLANSYKHDHRCVAGISLVTKKWVRLIGLQVPGCLTMKETCYSDGKQAALLDVFEVELGEKCGSNCHPEDVYVLGKPWRLANHATWNTSPTTSATDRPYYRDTVTASRQQRSWKRQEKGHLN